MSRIKKPCPACKKTDQYRPTADDICIRCSKAIENWNQHVAEVNTNPDLSTVKLAGAHHWYPGFYFGGHSHGVKGMDETRTELGKLFAELGELSCVELLDRVDASTADDKDPKMLYQKPHLRDDQGHLNYPTGDGSNGYANDRCIGRMNARTLEVLRQLFDRTARFAEMAYISGLQDGRSILLQLAQGGLSADTLAEKDVNIAKKVQNAARLHDKIQAQGLTDAD